ncbi:MAG: enoyl-CoA hydratase-related protein [Sulfuritalea sp.]|jgi:putative two-component system hydrogenase maturation factor HypX/HoxX|nr:enoyl-CoA hydratase-related protein [Sulfuritalea sp.]
MRILLLTHAFNGLTQRLGAELQERGHEVSIEFDIADSVAEEAVALFRPHIVVAPYLRRAIPESIWSRYVCLVVHPGIIGDRGPSALDWAIQRGEVEWGVTVLQAEAALDAGPVWASAVFSMRSARKSSLYRNEVTQAATSAVLQAVERFAAGDFKPTPLAEFNDVHGSQHPPMRQADRAIDWQHDDTATVLRKINAADGFPGVADTLFGVACHIFDAWPEAVLRGAPDARPGDLLARRETAVLRRTADGAVWIGHVKRVGEFKLPVALAFAAESIALADAPLTGWWRSDSETWQDIAYEESGGVGFLHFEFYNGAMSTSQCERLRSALAWAKQRPVQVLVLMGGADFWSNGIHLNVIEVASLGDGSAADESWSNINAMNDLACELIESGGQITVAALAGNAGAGGCFLARAADLVWAREGVILNPHYRNMGNLHGSEYWTYLLPRRVGADAAQAIMRNRQPLTAQRAAASGFIDACLAGDVQAFRIDVARRAVEIAAASDLAAQLAAKRERRARDEAEKPLAAYREEELAHMRRNFYGFDPSYHVARHHFVTKSPASWTPRHLARHRDLGWRVPA